MKSIVIGLAAAVLIAVGAAVVLGSIQHSTAERYASQSVRL
ncbi:MAG TPA: hypothetical protein VD995_14460 [Azospirillum sp.]|nr:hypothetical protein [Azospirillum sp.]